MLMAIYGIDAHAAFDLLKWRSQETNVKLRPLAEQIVADFLAVAHDEALPARSVYDNLLLTAQERITDVDSERRRRPHRCWPCRPARTGAPASVPPAQDPAATPRRRAAARARVNGKPRMWLVLAVLSADPVHRGAEHQRADLQHPRLGIGQRLHAAGGVADLLLR